MKIGILQCDNVRSTLSAQYGEYPTMFEDRIRANCDAPDELEFVTYAAHDGMLPTEVDECDAYIITGSRASVLELDEIWIHQLQNFIVRLSKANIKTVGICFGHQIMALAMGGKVERADNGWQIGIHYNEVQEYSDFMDPKTGGFNITMFCEDQVVKPGDDAKVIAKSDKCEYAMLQYGENMLSTQGHPEFTPDFTKALLAACKDDFPAKRFENSLASFDDKELDTNLLFSWFWNFIATNKQKEEPNTATIG